MGSGAAVEGMARRRRRRRLEVAAARNNMDAMMCSKGRQYTDQCSRYMERDMKTWGRQETWIKRGTLYDAAQMLCWATRGQYACWSSVCAPTYLLRRDAVNPCTNKSIFLG